jgi:hypothetical protein
MQGISLDVSRSNVVNAVFVGVMELMFPED